MSADDGIFIAQFPNGEFRVAHTFASVIDELETHFYSPQERMVVIQQIFSGPVFTNETDALEEAWRLLHEVDFTEYGICSIQFQSNFGELGEVFSIPSIPEGACLKCSYPGGSSTFHSIQRGCDK